MLSIAAPAQAANFTVTSFGDSGPGSLRQMLAAAALGPGADTITFLPELAGRTIRLLGEIRLADADAVTVNAAEWPDGVTLAINGQHRHFAVSGVANLSLSGLTLTGGRVPGGSGGAIHNTGRLTLTRCTLAGNSAADGGAIFKTLSLAGCTFYSNSAVFDGGALYDEEGYVVMRNSTLT